MSQPYNWASCNRSFKIFSLSKISSVQFSRSVMSDSLWPHELQHPRPPCLSPIPGVHSDSRPSSQWCHPAISSLVVPFFSCLQSLPASKSFPMKQDGPWQTGMSYLPTPIPKPEPGTSQDWSHSQKEELQGSGAGSWRQSCQGTPRGGQKEPEQSMWVKPTPLLMWCKLPGPDQKAKWEESRRTRKMG